MQIPGWAFLIAAITLEVAGTTSMKFSDGFRNLLPSILVFIFYGLSFTSLNFALREIDVSVAYAIWSGVGTVAISIIGFMAFREPMSAVKIISIGLIVIGVVGLNLSSQAQ